MAFRLDQEQRIAAVRHYYQSGSNAAEASRRLSEEFRIHEVQGRNIKSLVDKFERTGSVNDAPRSGRPVTATSDDKGEQLETSLIDSPQKSVRRLSRELEISRQSVHNLLRKRNLKPYIPRLFHALHDGDADRRLEFSEMFLDLMRDDTTLLDKIWWSDEACFKLNGHINRHNCTYWSHENPYVVLEKEVNLPGITVWAAISSSGVIGPFFFEAPVTGERYLDMLQTFFFPQVQQQRDFLFQQDGAPPHYARCVREWLDINFHGRWIGRRGPIDWPARSPDLSPMDFFVWGVLKDMVYKEKPRTIPDLRRLINDKFATIDVEVCQKVCRSVASRLHSCVEHDGEQFEVFRS